jgi:O-antigen ligase
MGTIQTYQGDSSASTRVAVWKWTMEYVQTHPMGGGFEAYRQNKIRYEKVNIEHEGAGQASVERSLEVDSARAYHSAYFEMLGEQGYPGLIIWLLINVIGVFRMEVLRRRYKKPEAGQEWIAPLASALQNAHIVYLLGATFIAIAFQPFVYMLIGAQIGLDTYLARKRGETAWQPLRKPRLSPA